MIKMVELNHETILDELTNLEKKKNVTEIPEILEKYLESIATNGETIFPWCKLQPLIRRKLEFVMNDFNDKCPTDNLPNLPNVEPFDFEDLKGQILESIECFPSAPFTIQRICEMVTNPNKHYKRTDKFMRAVEKNIRVVSTVEPKSAGNSTFDSTSSYKSIFSSSPSSISSLPSPSLNSPIPSTSLLINGIPETMPLNDETNANHKSHLNMSPVSPNSLPLSPSSVNSPPDQHLAPLQQLDSFTTVFASSPSTPLSVVSDIQPYESASVASQLSASASQKTGQKSIGVSLTNDASDKNHESSERSHSPLTNNHSNSDDDTPTAIKDDDDDDDDEDDDEEDGPSVEEEQKYSKLRDVVTSLTTKYEDDDGDGDGDGDDKTDGHVCDNEKSLSEDSDKNTIIEDNTCEKDDDESLRKRLKVSENYVDECVDDTDKSKVSDPMNTQEHEESTVTAATANQSKDAEDTEMDSPNDDDNHIIGTINSEYDNTPQEMVSEKLSPNPTQELITPEKSSTEIDQSEPMEQD